MLKDQIELDHKETMIKNEPNLSCRLGEKNSVSITKLYLGRKANTNTKDVLICYTREGQGQKEAEQRRMIKGEKGHLLYTKLIL